MVQFEFRVKFPTDAEFERMFATVRIFDRYKVLDRAATAAAGIVRDRARENAPRSSKTGSKKKWSKAMTTTGTPANESPRDPGETPLWKTIGVTIKKYEGVTWAGVGPTWPDGNKVFFNSAHKKGGRNVVYWGRPQGRVRIETDNWLKRSHDETISQQLSAMKASLKKSLDEMMPNG